MSAQNTIKIGLLEDNEIDAMVMSKLILKAGYSCFLRDNTQGFIDAVIQDNLDALILDWYLPDGNAMDVIDAVRNEHNIDIPVLIVSADDDPNILTSLDAGADDFIQKPLTANAPQVLQRLKNLLVKYGKMARAVRAPTDQSQPYTKDNCLLYQNKSQPLTGQEMRILDTLLSMSGSLVYRETIFCNIWNQDDLKESKRLDSLMYRLRKKIKTTFGDEIQIENVHGFGYRLTAK